MGSSKYPTQEFFKVNIYQNNITGLDPTNNLGSVIRVNGAQHYRKSHDMPTARDMPFFCC